MDVHARLAGIRQVVAGARAMPMSASCVVNRAELLGSIDALADMLPAAFGESDRVLANRDSVISAAHEQAEAIVAEAHGRQEGLVSDSDIHRGAEQEADRLLAAARAETSSLRQETDDYVDERLATFELTLTRTLEAVRRGRDRLHERSALGFDGAGDDIVLPDPGP